MTPLHRWVLLVTLLGRAMSIPVHTITKDACVYLCHEGYEPIELDDSQKLVLQSDGSNVEARSALRLCLTPCSPDDLYARTIFETFGICRALWTLLAEQRGCDCTSLTAIDRNDPPPVLQPEDAIKESNRLWVMEVLTKDQPKFLEPFDEFLRKVSREIPGDDTKHILESVKDLAYSVDQNGIYKSLIEMDAAATDTWVPHKHRYQGYDENKTKSARIVNNEGQAATATTEASSSEEDPVDWEMWCMAQCDNGKGGSACNCDIIP